MPFPSLSRFTVLPVTRIDNGNGLVGWWPFYDGQINATDYSGNGLRGTASGTITQSYGLNGTTALKFVASPFIDLGTPTLLNIVSPNPMTICAWVFGVALAGGVDEHIFSKGFDGTNTQYQFTVGTTGLLRFGTYNGAFRGSTSSGGVANNLWTHTAGVYDGTTWFTYRNGALDGSSAQIGPISTTRKVYIGAVDINGTPGQYIQAILSDVRVYNRALSPAEINSIYNIGILDISEPELQTMFTSAAAAAAISRSRIWSGFGQARIN